MGRRARLGLALHFGLALCLAALWAGVLAAAGKHRGSTSPRPAGPELCGGRAPHGLLRGGDVLQPPRCLRGSWRPQRVAEAVAMGEGTLCPVRGSGVFGGSSVPAGG